MKVKAWIQASRLFSFTASIVPVLLSCALSYRHPSVNWGLSPIILLGALAALVTSVMFNDYYDFANKVDSKSSFGSSRVLVDGLLPPKQLFAAAWAALFVAAACGTYLIYLRGTGMFFLILAGLLAAYFYTGKPGYKYYALGELMVFLMFGPLMVAGSYLALTGDLGVNALLTAVPVGLLATAIVNGNNVRDLEHDRKAGIKTLPIMAGKTAAIYIYIAFVLSAYLSVFALTAARMLPIWSLLTFITMPMALNLFADIKSSNRSRINIIDASTAKLHLAFGLILIISILAGKC
jgi:1,4-dihydroxy-2-naphthoate polyprenyltransferase